MRPIVAMFLSVLPQFTSINQSNFGYLGFNAKNQIYFGFIKVNSGKTEVKIGKTKVKSGQTEVNSDKTEINSSKTEVNSGKTEVI